MSSRDRYGLPLSSMSSVAAEYYRNGVDLLLSLWPGADEALDAAIAADPEFALAHAARARLYAIRAQVTEARALIAKAVELASKNGSEREKSHVGVLAYAINGQAAKALPAALQHIDAWPRDVVILSLPLGAFGLFAFSGMADHDQARVDLCERYARHLPENDWWFLTYRGWAQGENGNVAVGRELTQRALEMRRNNVNAAHAVAHVLYESGANDEAGGVIAGWLPGYNRSGILHGHIAWHGALIALEQGDLKGALSYYQEYVAPPVTYGVPLNVISDTASFLWRMQAYGHPVPKQLWHDAAQYSNNYFQQAGFPFADFHMAMLAAATGDRAAVEQRAQALADMVLGGNLRAGSVVPILCRALQAFADEKYADVAAMLEPVLRDVVRLGGSGAQREIAEDTLLVALMRAGEASKAKMLLDHRLHRRASPRDSRWLAGLVAS